jgi:hypothetical protein
MQTEQSAVVGAEQRLDLHPTRQPAGMPAGISNALRKSRSRGRTLGVPSGAPSEAGTRARRRRGRSPAALRRPTPVRRDRSVTNPALRSRLAASC